MKQAQAAMEFLMNYGWAFLVVFIAIGALAFFGIFNPEKFMQDEPEGQKIILNETFCLQEMTIHLPLFTTDFFIKEPEPTTLCDDTDESDIKVIQDSNKRNSQPRVQMTWRLKE